MALLTVWYGKGGPPFVVICSRCGLQRLVMDVPTRCPACVR